MKTKVAQHVPRTNISIWHLTFDLYVTFDHRHENKSCSLCPKSQGIKLDKMTTWQLGWFPAFVWFSDIFIPWRPIHRDKTMMITMITEIITMISMMITVYVYYHDDYRDDYHDNYHEDYHDYHNDYCDDYHEAWTLNLTHQFHLWKHCFPCLPFQYRICCDHQKAVGVKGLLHILHRGPVSHVTLANGPC